MTTWRGGCHCGAVAFEVEGELRRVEECNCSICARRAYLHWIVPRAAFRLLTPWDALTAYRFGTGVAQHWFCRTCGICSFYVPRSDPDGISVNARCLEGADLARLEVVPFDGRHWEEAYRRSRRAEPPQGKSSGS
jgi:hypothetical protein